MVKMFASGGRCAASLGATVLETLLAQVEGASPISIARRYLSLRDKWPRARNAKSRGWRLFVVDGASRRRRAGA